MEEDKKHEENKSNKRLSSTRNFGAYRDGPNFHDGSRSQKKQMHTFPLPILDSESKLDDDDQRMQDQESFFDLMTTFASLDLPDDKEELEQCPLCPQSFLLSEFAPHVLECIKQLDEVEQEHQLQIDRRIAESLSDRTPEMVTQMFEFQAPSICPQGSSCTRTDAGHFQAVHHPSVPCPMCSVHFEVFQINAHINLCLTKGPDVHPFSRVGAPRTVLATPVDEDDSDEEDAQDVKRKSLLARLTRAQSEDEDDHKGLSTRQIKAMSQHILQEKAKMAPDGLFQMLNSFKTLGFTAETLTRQLSQDTEKEKEKET